MSLPARLVSLALLIASCGPGARTSTATQLAAAEAPAQGGEEAVEEASPAAAPPPVATQPTPPALTAACLDDADVARDRAHGFDCMLLVMNWRYTLELLSTAWQSQAVSRFSSALQPAEMAVLRDTFGAHASAEVLYAALHERLRHDLAQLDFGEWLAWSRSPLARKYMAALAIHSVPEADRTWLRDHPPSARRKKLIQEHVRLAWGERQARQLYVRPVQAMLAAATAAAPGSVTFDAEALARASRAKVDAILRMACTGLAYMFRDLSDQELSELNAGLAQPESQRVNELLLAALDATIDEAARPLGPPFWAAVTEVATLTNTPPEPLR